MDFQSLFESAIRKKLIENGEWLDESKPWEDMNLYAKGVVWSAAESRLAELTKEKAQHIINQIVAEYWD